MKKRFTSIASAAFIIGLAGLLSRFLGLVRDHMFAYKFGASSVLDMYYSAFRIPDLIYNLVILGALSAGFIPILTGYLKQAEKEKPTTYKQVWSFVNTIMNIGAVGLIICGVLGFIFSDWLMNLLVPGFELGMRSEAAMLTRVMFLSPLFLGISGIIGGVLQTFRIFTVYALAPIMYNIGIIIGVVFFYDWWGMLGLGFGVVLGSFLHMLLQIPSLYRLGYSYQPIMEFLDPRIRELGLLMIPRMVALGITQLNLVVVTMIASTLSVGSLAVFNLANNIQSVPIGLFGVSFAIASFPFLTSHVEDNDRIGFTRTFTDTLIRICFWVAPVSVVYLLFRAQITRLILGSGSFDWSDTIRTLDAVGVFALSLWAQALIPLSIRGFFAIRDTITPLIVSCFGFFLNIILSLYLVRFYDMLGLVMAFSISMVAQCLILLFYLHYKKTVFDRVSLIRSLSQIIIASIAFGGVAQLVKYAIGTFLRLDGYFELIIQLSVSLLFGIISYILILLALDNEEMRDNTNKWFSFYKKRSINKKAIG